MSETKISEEKKNEEDLFNLTEEKFKEIIEEIADKEVLDSSINNKKSAKIIGPGISFQNNNFSDLEISNNSLLDQMMAVTSANDFDMRGNSLEDGLESIDVEEKSKEKPLEMYSSDNSSYQGIGGIVKGSSEVHSIQELEKLRETGVSGTLNSVSSEGSEDVKMYDVQRTVEDARTVGKLEKYSF